MHVWLHTAYLQAARPLHLPLPLILAVQMAHSFWQYRLLRMSLPAVAVCIRPLSPMHCLLTTNVAFAALFITLHCATALWTWLLLQAILLVQQNKTTTALEVLEPLFEHIEPMQENVAIRVCLLLMELHLTGSNYVQAASKVSSMHCILAEQQRLAVLCLQHLQHEDPCMQSIIVVGTLIAKRGPRSGSPSGLYIPDPRAQSLV